MALECVKWCTIGTSVQGSYFGIVWHQCVHYWSSSTAKIKEKTSRKTDKSAKVVHAVAFVDASLEHHWLVPLPHPLLTIHCPTKTEDLGDLTRLFRPLCDPMGAILIASPDNGLDFTAHPFKQVVATILMHPTPNPMWAAKITSHFDSALSTVGNSSFCGALGSGVVIYMCALHTSPLESLTTVIAINCFCYFLWI